jgi:hypothetical protein
MFGQGKKVAGPIDFEKQWDLKRTGMRNAGSPMENNGRHEVF